MQKPLAVWFIGLSASGKSTLADLVFDHIKNKYQAVRLDGDSVREKRDSGIDFSPAGRDKNIKHVISVAKEHQAKGNIIVASFITPYKHHREWLREELKNYIEIYTNSPLSVCEKRDPKGLYKKARRGEIDFFTGIQDDFHKPINPHLEIDTGSQTTKESIAVIITYLEENYYI